jgi:hypothetical protein
LHYEVKIAGKNINPVSVKTTSGEALQGKKLLAFTNVKNYLDRLSKELENKDHVIIERNNKNIY